MRRPWLLASLLVLLGAAPPGFEPVAERAGVAVFRHPGGPGVALYAEGEIAASPERVLAVLLDYERHGCFVHHLAESRLLRREPGVLWVYQRLDLPLLADRDFTLKVTWRTDGGAAWLRFVTDNDQGPPPRKGVVRVRQHEGGWRLEPMVRGGAQTTRARYQARLDLAGSLPGWLARAQAAKEIPALFEGLRREVR